MVHQFIEVLINGITISGPYAIVAIGLSLVYGVSKVFNYSYGSLITVGAYLTWFLFSMISWMNYPVAFLLSMAFMFVLGLLIEGAIPRVLRRQPNWEITTIIATLGLGILLSNVILLVFGPYTKALPQLGVGAIKLGVTLNGDRLLMLLVALGIAFGVKVFLGKTRTGMCLRAVSQDLEGAKVVGLPINRVFAVTFGLSTLLAGISGVFLGAIYFLAPMGGWDHFIKAFVIVALGGVGSVDGALYAAFILGITESLVQWIFGPMWVMPFWFLVLLLILTFRPKGLLGVR